MIGDDNESGYGEWLDGHDTRYIVQFASETWFSRFFQTKLLRMEYCVTLSVCIFEFGNI